MSYNVEALEPRALWGFFDQIRRIPHGSGNEEALGEAILTWAREKKLAAKTDETGNIVIRIPATAGCENAPTVVLQGHIDMVCEKNEGTEFDFERDAIVLRREGDWLHADGTTLGADNGIGVAAGLAMMDLPDAVHGPLEVLLTIDEERGLVGARNLKPGFIKGRMLFNLDSEEDGIFCVGCAGGRDVDLDLPLQKTPRVERAPYRLEIKGLRGGHSGMDIIHNRGNAIRLLTRAIWAAANEVSLDVASIDGGDKHNAIPREARATVLIDSDDEARLREVLDRQLAGFREEFGSGDPDLALTVNPTDAPPAILASDSRQRVLHLLLGLPNGVLAMSRDMPEMVETSCNLARVRTEGDRLSILLSVRSSVASAIEGVLVQIEGLAGAVRAEVARHEGYPGWKPNMESRMLAQARKVWKAVHGTDAKFWSIHAGLECGIIGERYPGMDMISLGPTIENPHSPDERVHIPSVKRLFDFQLAFLRALAEM